MLDRNKLRDFSEFVRNNFLEKSNELVDALDLVNMVFDEIYDGVTIKIGEYLAQRNIKSSQELMPFCETITEIKNMVNEYSLLFASEEDVEDENMDDDKEKIFRITHLVLLIRPFLIHYMKILHIRKRAVLNLMA